MRQLEPEEPISRAAYGRFCAPLFAVGGMRGVKGSARGENVQIFLCEFNTESCFNDHILSLGENAQRLQVVSSFLF